MWEGGRTKKFNLSVERHVKPLLPAVASPLLVHLVVALRDGLRQTRHAVTMYSASRTAKQQLKYTQIQTTDATSESPTLVYIACTAADRKKHPL